MSSAAKSREEVLGMVRNRLRPNEDVVAVLPFAATPKRPKGPDGKVRVGIYQSYRRYRPLVATNSRLFVLETGRTPHPRRVLAEFPLHDVDVVDVVPARFNQSRVLLELPGVGTVPFDFGRQELPDLAKLRAALERS